MGLDKLPSIKDRGQTDRVTILADHNTRPSFMTVMFNLRRLTLAEIKQARKTQWKQTIPAHNRRSTHISSRCIASLQLIAI